MVVEERNPRYIRNDVFFRINENEMKKILVLAYFVISCYFDNSSCFVISLNFDKQFQEMMYEFKIKPIRVTGWARQINSSPLGAYTWKPIIAKLNKKLPVFMHNIMKKSDLNFIFMENFLKKDYLF